jgi:CO/xanthine dehydrogenase FAD-binding subunit
MQAFHLLQPSSLDAALAAGHAQGAKFVAGGTDLMQLLKDNVEVPTALVDLEHVGLSGIQAGASELRLGAMARMSDVAAHSGVRGRLAGDLSSAGSLCVPPGTQHGHDWRQSAAADAVRLFPGYWFHMQQA